VIKKVYNKKILFFINKGKITGRFPFNLFSTKCVFFYNKSGVAFGGKMKVGEKQKLAIGPNYPQ